MWLKDIWAFVSMFLKNILSFFLIYVATEMVQSPVCLTATLYYMYNKKFTAFGEFYRSLGTTYVFFPVESSPIKIIGPDNLGIRWHTTPKLCSLQCGKQRSQGRTNAKKLGNGV